MAERCASSASAARRRLRRECLVPGGGCCERHVSISRQRLVARARRTRTADVRVRSPAGVFEMNSRRRIRGLTLIELIIAMAISCTIVAGALSLYGHVHETWRANERVARMQEQGRVALSVIEPDVELAGYYGFSNAPESIRFVRGANSATVLAIAAQMRQFPLREGDPLPSPVGALPPGAHACGVNFGVDLSLPVQGSNDVFALGRGATCTPYRNHA